jgi:SAM-dependent methyltransferase
MKIPARIAWAVDQLALEGTERVLEIGCGRGVAASLVCVGLTSGHLAAIDRSSKAVAAARERNSIHRTAGKVTFVECALADFTSERDSFEKVFAINVNLFWTNPSRELPVIARLLAPRGRLYLFYEPPAPEQRARLATLCSGNLTEGGFSLESLEAPESPAMLAIVAMVPR